VLPLLPTKHIVGISHITGGGIEGNTKRILPAGCVMSVHWNAWRVPEIFHVIQHAGNIETEEMRQAFNLGIGLILVVKEEDVDGTLRQLQGNNACVIGTIEAV
jgi:phosphoribosylformylglycinamidine cyclo-ligase